MVKSNKNKKLPTEEEEDFKNPKKIIKESEKVIKELVNELKDCLNYNITKKIVYNKPGVYTGTGSIKSTCTACRQRLWG